jgi:hypothetical protein
MHLLRSLLFLQTVTLIEVFLLKMSSFIQPTLKKPTKVLEIPIPSKRGEHLQRIKNNVLLGQFITPSGELCFKFAKTSVLLI